MSTDRIKQLEARVAQAKKDVRATMSIAELSKESVRDIVSEVGETQAYLNTLFGRSDRELRGSTVSLREEINKLVKEGTDADASRLKEIRERIKDITKVASEEGDAESEFLKEYGMAAASGIGRARKHRIRGDKSSSGRVYGEGLFSTVFGSSFSNWMIGDDKEKGSKRRQRAELKLGMAQADLGSAVGGSPAEREEERREGEVRQKEIKQKENNVIDLLEEIRNNTKLLLGGHGGGFGGGGGGAGAGAGAGQEGAGGGGLASLFSLDNLLMATMLGGPIKGIASKIISSRAGQGVAGLLGLGARSNEMRQANKLFGMGKGGFQGFSAAKASGQGLVASKMTKLSGAAKALGGSRVFGGLISFGITEALYQVGTAFIDSYNEETAKAQGVLSGGQTYMDAGGVTRSAVDRELDMFGNVVKPGTVIFDPSVPNLESKDSTGRMVRESDNQAIARGKLKANEKEIELKLQEAERFRKMGLSDKGAGFDSAGNEINGQEMANQLLAEARGLVEHRAQLVRNFGPRTQDEAVSLLKFSNKSRFGAMQRTLDRMEDSTSWWERTDRGNITDTSDLLSLLDPKKMNQQFFQDISSVGSSMTEKSSQMRMMSDMGFEPLVNAAGKFRFRQRKGLGESIQNRENQQRIERQQADPTRNMTFEEKRDHPNGSLLPYNTQSPDGTIIPGYQNPAHPNYNGGKRPSVNKQVSMLPSQNNIPRAMKLDRNASALFNNTMFAGAGGAGGPDYALVNAPSMNVQNTTNYIADPYDESSLADGDRIAMMNDVNYNLRYS